MLKAAGSVFKRFIQLLIILLILLTSVMIYFIYYFDPNNYKDLIVKQFEQATGGKVDLKGDIKIKLFPEPHVELKDSVFNIKMFGNDVTFITEFLEFDLALEPLLKKDIHFYAILSKGIKVVISQDNKAPSEITFDKFKGKVDISDCCLKFSHFSLTSMKNTLHGNIFIASKGDKPKISGDIFAEFWQFSEDKDPSKNALANVLQALSPFEIFLKVQLNQLHYNKTLFNNVKFNLSSTDNIFKLDPTLEVAKGKLSGNISLQPKKSTLNIAFDLKLKQVQAKEVLDMLGLSPPPVKGNSDLDFRGNTIGNGLSEWQSGLTGTLAWRFQDLKFDQVKNNPVKGDVTLSFTKGKVKNISGNFLVNNWQFEEDLNPSKNVVTDLLLSIAPYKHSFAVKVNNLQYKRALFKNVQFLLTSENKLIKLNPTADFANGKLTSRFTLRPDKDNSKIDFNINLRNADAPAVISNFGQNKHIVSGKLNFDLKGNTVGNNMSKWIASLSGNMLLNLTRARLHPNARKTISQLGDEFRCIVMKSKIREGVIRGKNNLGFDSSSLSGLGSGEYNLKTDQLNFIFQMVTNNKINLNLGGTLHTVKVTGTLEDPNARITSEELMRQGSRIALGIVTGGYSLLVEKLQDVLLQKKSSCQVVLDGS